MLLQKQNNKLILAAPKAKQQINSTKNVEQQATIFSIIEEGKEFQIFDKELEKYSNFYFLLLDKMTEYNTLNVKLSNFQLNKLKAGIKVNTEVTLETSSNIVGEYKDENVSDRLLLTNTQVSKLRKAFYKWFIS